MNAPRPIRPADSAPVGGIFVGGGSTRMGRPKGLIVGPDGRTLIARARHVLVGAGAQVVLVGRRNEYEELGLHMLEDALENGGPLAGLVSLLEVAEGQRAIVLACDMPFVTKDDLLSLLRAEGAIVASRREERWEPFCAAYAPSVLPIARRRLEAGQRSMQGLLSEVGATEVSLDPAHLVDWDSPEDVSVS